MSLPPPASRAIGEIEDIERLLACARDRVMRAIRPARPDLAGLLYALRRLRDEAFGDNAGAFGEPAWDMMLELFQAESDGRAVAVSDAGLDAGIPATTALRHLNELERRGLVERRRDPLDRRRSYIRTSDKAYVTMVAWLDRATVVLGLGPVVLPATPLAKSGASAIRG